VARVRYTCTNWHETGVGLASKCKTAETNIHNDCNAQLLGYRHAGLSIWPAGTKCDASQDRSDLEYCLEEAAIAKHLTPNGWRQMHHNYLGDL
jgi:hypothetical protein